MGRRRAADPCGSVFADLDEKALWRRLGRPSAGEGQRLRLARSAENRKFWPILSTAGDSLRIEVPA